MKKNDGPPVDQMNPNNFELNAEQWSFMYQYYPEYSGAPFDMMTWLYGQAKAHEDMYARPDGRTKTVGVNEDSKEEDLGLDGESHGLSDLIDNKGKNRKKDAIAEAERQKEINK